jgi:methylmalonyl-CoA/ethylmalonyl-CoA epimerase
VERSPSPGRGRYIYRGEPAVFAIRLAFSSTTPQLELIQPLAGPSIYDEWLASHSYGMHHLGVVVSSLTDAIAEMRAVGYEVIQSGAGYGPAGDGGHAYFDTADALGYLLEAIEPPRG